MVKKISIALIIFLSCLVAGFSLLHPGLIPTHDGEYHIVRFYEFNKALIGGDVYPRWAADLNNGYGIPLFNFVYPLPNYFASLIHLFGFSFIDAFKIEMFLSLIIGGFLFYLWSREFWGILGGLTSSVFYIFAPYHFADIYIRGSVGEVLALAIFPGLLWSLTLLIKSGKKIFIPISSLFLGILVMSHNILALMFVGFTFFYCIFLVYLENRSKVTLDLLKVFVIGLLFSSIFWLPAIFETKFTVGLQVYDIESNFPLLYQLIIPSWGSGFSSSDLGNQISLQIGIGNLFIIFLICLYMLIRHKLNKHKIIALFFISWFFLVGFLMLRVSEFIWKLIPLMNYFQFPWRFLSLEIIISSFLTGAVIYFFRAKLLVSIILIFIVVSLGYGYSSPAYYLNRDDNYYLSRSNFIDSTNSPGNAFNTRWFNSALSKTDKRIYFSKGEGAIELLSLKPSEYIFKAKVVKESELTINTAYFPGWVAYIDNKKATISKTDDGLFSFPISKGEHSVKVIFSNTYLRTIGEISFIFSSLIILFLFGKSIFDKIKK